MSAIHNLVVDLSGMAGEPDGFAPEPADERTLAWIDEVFGGWWSSEAAAGANIVARRDGAPFGFATIDAQGLRFRWLAGLAREPGVGLFGPFGVAPEERRAGSGRRLLRQGLAALRARGYTRALIAAVGEELVRYYAESCGARVAEAFDRAALLAPPARAVVMASGNGSNFQAVAEAARAGTVPLEIAALVANDASAFAIQRARAASVASEIVTWDRSRETRAHYDARLLERVRAYEPDLVLLLGWMHVLAPEFVAAFPETLNLHPAYLPLDPQRDGVTLPDGTTMPAFRGAHAVRDALAAGSRWVGATVHRVTPATDRGPVMARKPLRVEPGEEEAILMRRVHAVERPLVLAAITRWLFERPPNGGKEDNA